MFFWHVFIYEPLGSSHDGDMVVICSQTSTSIDASLIPLKDFVFSLILFPWYTEKVKSRATLLLRSQQHQFQLCMHVPLPWLAASTASNKSLCQHLHANMKMLTWHFEILLKSTDSSFTGSYYLSIDIWNCDYLLSQVMERALPCSHPL